MVCGNGIDSLKLRFSEDGKDVAAKVHADDLWQGYSGILHGGMICTLLDAAMTHYLFRYGIEAMTVDLNVRFKQAVPCTEILELRAKSVQSKHRLFQLCAELCVSNQICAQATGKFLVNPGRSDRKD